MEGGCGARSQCVVVDPWRIASNPALGPIRVGTPAPVRLARDVDQQPHIGCRHLCAQFLLDPFVRVWLYIAGSQALALLESASMEILLSCYHLSLEMDLFTSCANCTLEALKVALVKMGEDVTATYSVSTY